MGEVGERACFVVLKRIRGVVLGSLYFLSFLVSTKHYQSFACQWAIPACSCASECTPVHPLNPITVGPWGSPMTRAIVPMYMLP